MKNLKKWQKGGLIGLVIGVILGLYVFSFAASTSPYESWASWVSMLIKVTHFIPHYFLLLGHHGHTLLAIYDNYIFPGAIVLFYGGLGAILGKIQQSDKPLQRGLLTG